MVHYTTYGVEIVTQTPLSRKKRFEPILKDSCRVDDGQSYVRLGSQISSIPEVRCSRFIRNASLAYSTPLTRRWDDFVEKHSWGQIPASWEFHSLPSPDVIINLRLGLKSDRLDELFQHLSQSSDPRHERYGNHLSKQEVDELVAPHPDTVSFDTSWSQSINLGHTQGTLQ